MNIGGLHQNTNDDWEKQLRTREVGLRQAEVGLREKEVKVSEDSLEVAQRSLRVQRRMSLAQAFVAFAAVLASLAAAFAASQARNAVKVSEASSKRQADEDRLSTAITAIGGSTAAERVAGVTLLRRNVAARLYSATSVADRNDAYDLYTSSLDVLANYLRGTSTSAPAESTTSSGTSATPAAASAQAFFGPGYGIPHGQITPDMIYAAQELEQLLSMRDQVNALNTGRSPGIDLSHVELWGQPWSGVRFDWLGGHYMAGIDLRSANLSYSRWGTSDLTGAYLQCADLSQADLRHTTLAHADLRGANLTGADLRDAAVTGAHFDGAILVGAHLKGIIGSATGLSRSATAESASSWSRSACYENRSYWDEPRPQLNKAHT
jgi:pentapeptide repeat protein